MMANKMMVGENYNNNHNYNVKNNCNDEYLYHGELILLHKLEMKAKMYHNNRLSF